MKSIVKAGAAVFLGLALLGSCSSTRVSTNSPTGLRNGQTAALGLVSLDEAIEVAVAEIEAKVAGGSEITIANITAPREEIGNFLAEELIEKLSEGGKVILLAREAVLSLVEKEQEFQMSGLVSDASAVSIGHFLGAKVVVIGTFDRFEGFSQLRLRAVNVETSALTASPSARIQNSDPALANVTAPLKEIKAMPITEQALAHLNQGQDLLVERNYEGAIGEFNRMLAINSEAPEAYFYRGAAYSAQGDDEKANEDYLQVTRIDPNYFVENGLWNDADVRLVCESLINACLNAPRVVREIARRSRIPTVLVENFRNGSAEHIDTSIISSIMEDTIINSGKLDLAKQQNQIANAAATLGYGGEADFRLTGSIRTVLDRAGGITTRTYFVSVEMIDVEISAVMWMGLDSTIKKVIRTGR
jgi:tetratricopeptide (TPR) repeat protein